jgi:hypothetical protein
MVGISNSLKTIANKGLWVAILLLCLYLPAIVFGVFLGDHRPSFRYSFLCVILGQYHLLKSPEGHLLNPTDSDSWAYWMTVPLWMFAFLPWFLLLTFACAMIGGTKRTILYLRRFGLTSANRIISNSLANGLRTRFRILTLDDSAFVPQHKTPALTRTLTSIACVLILLYCSLPIVAIIWKLGSLMPGNTTMRWIRGTTEWILSLGASILLGLLWWAWFVVVALIILSLRRRHCSRIRIRNQDDISRFVLRIHQLSNWLRAFRLTAPTATVITTSDEVWRPAVLAFAEHTHVIVFDISVLTPSIAWELCQVVSKNYEHVVFVAHEEQLKSWTGNPANQVTWDLIKGCLSNSTLLHYRDQMTHSERREFYRELREAATRSARPRNKLGVAPRRGFSSCVSQGLLWAAAYAITCCMATVAVASFVTAMDSVFDILEL